MEKFIPHAARKAGYRSDIDGLRAVAVIAVLLFHINAKALPGGYLGVDIFFVISGFLITGIIQRGRLRGTFSYGDFYERRIRRIIPALYFMMAVSLVVAWMVLWPHEFKDFGKSVKYVALFTGNFEFFEAVQDYFSQASDPVPLLHTWSLGIEEQFYFILPIVLLILGRFGKWNRAQMYGLGSIFVASLAAYLWKLERAPMSAFFLLPFRAWELLAGGILSLSMPAVARLVRIPVLREILAWLGLLMIAIGFIVVDGEGGKEGIGAMLACAGTVALIGTGAERNTVASKLLGVGGMTWLGAISYSLYLWHWPLIVFTGNHGGTGWVIGALIFFTSILLGWASWRWVERPFREVKEGKRKWVFVAWASFTIVFVLFGSYIRANEGVPGRFPPEVVELLQYGEKVPKVRTMDVANPPVIGAKGSVPTVALWGDSHARALLEGVEAAALTHNASFQAFILPGHAPVVGVTLLGQNSGRNAEYTDAVMKRLLSDPQIKTVILAARWSNPVSGLKAEGENTSRKFQGKKFVSEAERRNYYASCLGDMIRRLHAAGKIVYVVDPIPELNQNVPRTLAKLAYREKPLPEFFPSVDYKERHSLVTGVFDVLEKEGAARRIRPELELLENGKVRVRDKAVLFYQDSNHLTPEGALRLSDLFNEVFAGR